MRNKGMVSVYLCLIICALWLVISLAFRNLGIETQRLKLTMSSKGAVSSVKANYNNYIFEHYHILLFDKNCSGRGEAYIEQRIEEDIRYNVPGVNVEANINSFDMIMDNNYELFLEQINECVPYLLVEGGANHILDVTGGLDGTLPDSINEGLIAAPNEEEQNETPVINTDGNHYSDPRHFFRTFLSNGVLYFVLPESENPSTEFVDLSETPSGITGITGSELFDRIDFNDFNDLTSNLRDNASWAEAIRDAGAIGLYSRAVFNCLTNKGVNSDTVFQYELEYLVGGKYTDEKNLKETVDEIISIRLPVNFIHICQDAVKNNQIKTISVPIAMATPVPEKVIRYLIAGCWAYIESVVDVRGLMAGKRIAFFKNSSNWKTSLSNISECMYIQPEEDSHGLSYQDYLFILICINRETSLRRMLDLIELNTKQLDETFEIENAACGLSVNISSSGLTDCYELYETGY